MSGRLIAVVGPSGAGKDSVIRELSRLRPGLVVARRVITRPADDTEPFESVAEPEFARREGAGEFALAWKAHGLRYGIPASTVNQASAGQEVLANLSRSVLPEAAKTYPALTVLVVTASPETLAARLDARGREGATAIARRLSRPAPPMPQGLDIITVANDGTLRDCALRAQAALWGSSA